MTKMGFELGSPLFHSDRTKNSEMENILEGEVAPWKNNRALSSKTVGHGRIVP